MSPLYITIDPTEYLTPGQDGARTRVKIKHAARERAAREGFDTITIVDCRDNLIEEVATLASIRSGHYVIGYDVLVATTSPGLSSDHVQNLVWSADHGEVVAQTNTSLTLRILNAMRLDKLRRDPHFRISKIKIVRA